MGTRAESMATIDAALQEPEALEIDSADDTEPSIAAPHAAPGVDAPTPLTGGKPTLTADEKRAWDAARTEQEREAARQLQEQKAQQSAYDQLAGTTRRAWGNVIKGTQVRLESLPTPGSIMFPLVVLLIFFFLLIPVNGHTRLVWFWLVLSGNAEIAVGGQSDDSTGDTTPSTPTNNNTVTDTSPVPQLVPPSISGDNHPRVMTGVEGS